MPTDRIRRAHAWSNTINRRIYYSQARHWNGRRLLNELERLHNQHYRPRISENDLRILALSYLRYRRTRS